MQEITQALFDMQDLKYKDFQCALMPTVPKETVIGVRTPLLRQYARRMHKTPQAASFLEILPHTYYEENNLHAFLLEYEPSFEKAVIAVDRFLPYINNWATCDSFLPKVFDKNKDRMLPEIERWMADDAVYTVRYGIGLLMRYFLDDAFAPEQAEKVAALTQDEYYVKMMQSWYFATALAKQYKAILPFFTKNKLSLWVHNKSIQKAIESRRISPAQKAYLKTLKRRPL